MIDGLSGEVPLTGTLISTFQFSSTSQQILREAAQAEVVCITRTEDFRARLQDAEIVCSYWMPDDWRTLAPRLRWLQCSGAGVDGLLPTGVLDSDTGITVTTAAGIHASTISEYVFGRCSCSTATGQKWCTCRTAVYGLAAQV